jgi:transcriptional regulator with XRE-family HTH domain
MPDDPPQSLGQLLRTARLRRRLTQRELATRCGVTRTAISHLERDRKLPSLRLMGELAHQLRLNTARLIQILRRLPDR